MKRKHKGSVDWPRQTPPAHDEEEEDNDNAPPRPLLGREVRMVDIGRVYTTLGARGLSTSSCSATVLVPVKEILSVWSPPGARPSDAPTRSTAPGGSPLRAREKTPTQAHFRLSLKAQSATQDFPSN